MVSRPLLVVVAVLSLMVPMAQADGEGYQNFKNSLNQTAESAKYTPSETPDSDTLLSRLATYIQAFLSVLGVVFFLLIFYAGVLWMTDRGNADKAKKARGIIEHAIVGLLMIFLAYGITAFMEVLIQAGAGK